ncbi:MAG: hypothetical protein ACLS4A_13070 [Oscillospiraceae bacterium]
MPEDITLRTIQIDEKPLIYSLERKDVKNINLHVRKNGSVYVSANMAVPAEKIDAFLVSKAEFILNAQRNLRCRNSINHSRSSMSAVRPFIFRAERCV